MSLSFYHRALLMSDGFKDNLVIFSFPVSNGLASLAKKLGRDGKKGPCQKKPLVYLWRAKLSGPGSRAQALAQLSSARFSTFTAAAAEKM